jgi:hypothetical protein
MISGALCRGMSGQVPGQTPLGFGRFSQGVSAAGTTAAAAAAASGQGMFGQGPPMGGPGSVTGAGSYNSMSTASNLSSWPDNVPDKYDELLDKIKALLDVVTKDITGGPPATTTAAPAMKVEVSMITDTTSQVCSVVTTNTKFALFNDDKKIYKIDSPLMIYNDFLDITKYGSKDIEIADRISQILINKDKTIKPYIDAETALPDNTYTKSIKDALQLCRDFYDDVLSNTTRQKISDAKSNLSKYFKIEEGKQLARKALEALYNTALIKATKAHNMLISAAEDYFNAYIVYDNGQPDQLLSAKVSKASAEKTGAISDAARIMGFMSTIEEYESEANKQLDSELDDIKQYTSAVTSGPLAPILTTINKRYQKKLDFDQLENPTVTDVNTLLVDISDISNNYTQYMRGIRQTIIGLRGIIQPIQANFQQGKELYTDLLLKYGNAIPSIKESSKSEYVVRERNLVTIINKFKTLEDPVSNDIHSLELMLNKLEELYDIETILSAVPITQEKYQTNEQRKQDISAIGVIVREWDSFKNHVDVSMGMILSPTPVTQANYNILQRTYADISSTHAKVMAAKMKFDLAETLTDLTKNKTVIESYVDVSASRTKFNTDYGNYYTATQTSKVLTQGRPLVNIKAKHEYVKLYITDLLNDISTNGIKVPGNPRYLTMIVNREPPFAGIDITGQDISEGTITTIGRTIVSNLSNIITDKKIKLELTNYESKVTFPATTTGLQTQIDQFIRGRALPVMVGGGRHRVTRRRRTGSKRLRKTRARK